MKKLYAIIVVMVLTFATSSGAYADGGGHFGAQLTGGNEVSPVVTKARGQAVFNLKHDKLSYKLIVNNAERIVAVHIHCAPAGENGRNS